ncbi:ATP-binding cassette domain-containing protein [Duganella sp. FT92W]|uniref:ATP-binding cassette domain-containing protein n=1 Tax=Pseudoduganella rivuli TaxID=2666085 RepID=A0A7X2IJM3_9BURK|nr:ABC transporter ATP-binding protein [Pseudoduganella rivuli]MRV71217.1 ATP-binding cassette domain-containing protein [Pseudoduganella rivuli]
MNDYTIRASQLTLRHNGVKVLDNVSLDIPAGAVVGLVGRNGAGKSTLLRCLAGLAAPDSGSATLLNCPSLQLTDAVRERIGYVAQTPDLFEWMTVEEHLFTIGRAYPRWNEERCLALAARMDLPLNVRVTALSGGDQQKLSVVLALAHDPDVLLFDEPVASLDPMTRREFMRAIFSGERAIERTVIISSHILSDLERVVTHVAFIREGKLQLVDSWDAMLECYRLIPQAIANGPVPPEAVVHYTRGGQRLIDTRHAPVLAEAGRPLSLDELFVELNS